MRRAALVLAALLFYGAALGAGATGPGMPMLAVLAFTGLFFLWTVLMRTPGASPLAYLHEGKAGLLALHVAVQLALAALCVGLGTGLRVLAGIDVALPLALWIVVALSATLLARLAWPPGLADEMEAVLDAAVDRLETMNREAEDQMAESDAELHRAAEATPAERVTRESTLAALDALPEDADRESVARAIRQALHDMRPALLRETVLARADTPRDRIALALVVADPDIAAASSGHQDPAQAFESVVAAADAPALAIWADGCLTLLEAAEHHWRDMPAPDRLTEIATQIERDHEALAEDLVTLANRLEDIREEDDGAPDARADDPTARPEALADTDRDG